MVRTSGFDPSGSDSCWQKTANRRSAPRSAVQLRPGPPSSTLITKRDAFGPALNRNLVVFSFFLVLLGVAFNFYLLSFFGLLLMIPAFLSPPRTAPRKAPVPPRPEFRRITPLPPTRPSMEALAARPTPKVVAPPPPVVQPQTYTPALFPTSMFPSLSQMGNLPQPPSGAAERSAERDGLVEAGAILVLVKLLVG
jgi:hypothetical protein